MESITVFGPTHGSQLFLPSPNNLFPVGKLSYFPLTSLHTKAPKFVRLKATNTLTYDDQESNRTFKKLQLSQWTDHFHSVSVEVSEMDALSKEIESLKPKMKKRLMSSQGIDTTKKRILKIYLLVCLGIAHHFEEEIYETLKEGLGKVEEMMAGEDDLYTVSIIFWFFRTYGHHVSSDVFRKFKENNGSFKEHLASDAKGILSLYEAAHLRTTTDYILDEALSFASSHLELLAAGGTCPPHLSKRIRNALTLSQRWNMEMLVAVEYISFYEQEKDHDEKLLMFAKLSFKLVQLQYVQDLKIVTKWYKDVDFASKLPPYFKDRIVENNFLIQAAFLDPKFSRARIMYTKYFTVLGLLDDTFDRYASLPEAESLTNSLTKWDPQHGLDKQPDYLKFVLNFIFDTFEEFESELRPDGKLYGVKATIEEFKKVAKANFDIAKWAQAGHVPSFEEYMEAAEVVVTIYASLAGAFMYGFEEYGVNKPEAVRDLHKMVADADKAINEELLTTIGVPCLVLKAAMGNAQMIAICYNGYEGFTNPEGKTRDYITSMLVNQIRP